MTKSIPAFIEQFHAVEKGSVLKDVTVSVAGRIYALRSASSKLQFYDLHGEGSKIQIMANMAYAADDSACVVRVGGPRWGPPPPLPASPSFVQRRVGA